MRGRKKVWMTTMLLTLSVLGSSLTVFASDGKAKYVPDMYASIYSLIPPVVAIVLALITKEVYSSLFVGILIGGVFWSGFRLRRQSPMYFRMVS